MPTVASPRTPPAEGRSGGRRSMAAVSPTGRLLGLVATGGLRRHSPGITELRQVRSGNGHAAVVGGRPRRVAYPSDQGREESAGDSQVLQIARGEGAEWTTTPSPNARIATAPASVGFQAKNRPQPRLVGAPFGRVCPAIRATITLRRGAEMIHSFALGVLPGREGANRHGVRG